MTTFADDFVRLRLAPGFPLDIPLEKLGLEWPPPRRIAIEIVQHEGRALVAFDPTQRNPTAEASVYHRVSCSEISDEDRADMTRVCRGATYVLGAVPGSWL